jgi:methionyl-tRNA formyltransferase
MRVFFLLVDEPFYTPACLAPLVDRWHPSIAGAAFPRGFFDWKRIRSSLQLYGVLGTAVRTVRMLTASLRGGSVRHLFTERGIPTFDADDVNAPAFLERLRALGVDTIVSLNCPQKLKTDILSLPARGCINVHFGKLPRYRGILPIFHAVLNGEPSFGVTVHMMDEQLDNGAIILQRDVPIVRGDTLETLYPKGFAAASALLDEALTALERGNVTLVPNPASEKTYYSYPTREMIRAYRRAVQH